MKKYAGIVFVLCIVCVTLYFAFAFPINLFNLHGSSRHHEGVELLATQIVVRHGDKAPPLNAYFLDERRAITKPPEGFDELTNAGKRRLYSIGTFLRYRYYDQLLRGSPRALHVCSSDTDRCIESALALAAGLLPARDQWIWNNVDPSLSLASNPGGTHTAATTDPLALWQPVAVHTRERALDSVLWPHAECQSADKEALLLRNSTRYRQYVNEFRHDLELLKQYTGHDDAFDTDPLLEAERVNDALKSRSLYAANNNAKHKSSLPWWYTKQFAKRLAHIADVADEVRFGSDTMLRLRAGPLLHQLFEFFHTITKQDQHTGVRMNVYVTHDQVLVALMNALQIYTGVPSFGTALVLELYYDTIKRDYYVNFYHMSEGTEPHLVPEPLRVHPAACGENSECALDHVRRNLRHLMLDETTWRRACQDPSLVPETDAAPTPTHETDVNQSSTVQPMFTNSTVTTDLSNENDSASAIMPNDMPIGTSRTDTESSPTLSQSVMLMSNTSPPSSLEPVSIPSPVKPGLETTDEHQMSKTNESVGIAPTPGSVEAVSISSVQHPGSTRDIYIPETVSHDNVASQQQIVDNIVQSVEIAKTSDDTGSAEMSQGPIDSNNHRFEFDTRDLLRPDTDITINGDNQQAQHQQTYQHEANNFMPRAMTSLSF